MEFSARDTRTARDFSLRMESHISPPDPSTIPLMCRHLAFQAVRADAAEIDIYVPDIYIFFLAPGDDFSGDRSASQTV